VVFVCHGFLDVRFFVQVLGKVGKVGNVALQQGDLDLMDALRFAALGRLARGGCEGLCASEAKCRHKLFLPRATRPFAAPSRFLRCSISWPEPKPASVQEASAWHG
jgi:hypothetical protein